jgi:thymidylate synthase ThyX
MTTISAKVVAASTSPHAGSIYSLELVYPRFIHSEFMTHRVFSRNASSSRAIPVERQIQMIKDDPAVPLFWGANKPGMQATEECEKPVGVRNTTDKYGYTEHHFRFKYLSREEAWLDACNHTLARAKAYNFSGYHKQIINRLLEPFAHIKVLVTATEWENFFELRDHVDAEPHIALLARRMREAIDANKDYAIKLPCDEWHLPYVTSEDRNEARRRSNDEDTYWKVLRKVSVGRCARVSYNNHDGSKADFEKDMRLHDQLVAATPIHASPAEHQATPDRYMIKFCAHDGRWFNPQLHGNFKGFIQYRKMLEQDLAKLQKAS